jgi:hypothetical protein
MRAGRQSQFCAAAKEGDFFAFQSLETRTAYLNCDFAQNFGAAVQKCGSVIPAAGF